MNNQINEQDKYTPAAVALRREVTALFVPGRKAIPGTLNKNVGQLRVLQAFVEGPAFEHFTLDATNATETAFNQAVQAARAIRAEIEHREEIYQAMIQKARTVRLARLAMTKAMRAYRQ